MTPERLAALEEAAADQGDADRELVSVIGAPLSEPVRLDEAESPVAGRRFTRS
jgi:hypothetical protein